MGFALQMDKPIVGGVLFTGRHGEKVRTPIQPVM